MVSMEQHQLIGTKEAQRILGFTRQGIYYLIETGVLTAYRCGKSKRIQVSRAEVESYRPRRRRE